MENHWSKSETRTKITLSERIMHIYPVNGVGISFIRRAIFVKMDMVDSSHRPTAALDLS